MKEIRIKKNNFRICGLWTGPPLSHTRTWHASSKEQVREWSDSTKRGLVKKLRCCCAPKRDPVCRLQRMLFSTLFSDLTLNVSRIGTNLKMPGQREIWIKVLYPSTIPSIDSSPWSSCSDFSCLNNPINVVETKSTIPQKWKNSENATTPFSEGCVLRYLLLKSAEVRPKNTAFPMKNPERWPTVSQVEAYPTFSLDSNVSDQPSTAMSWVAARKFRQKKITVRKRMLGLSSPFSFSSTSMCWVTKKRVISF